MAAAAIAAQVWLDTYEHELKDLRPTEAAALIEQAGLRPRVVKHPSGWMTQEQQRDRVNLWLDANGEVQRITAG